MRLFNSKSELRTQMCARLKNISPAVRTVESMELCARLGPQLRSAHTILFFAPLPDELDVWPVLESSIALGNNCALPFFETEKNIYGARVVRKLAADIAIGKFGVREPAPHCAEIPLNTIDLVLVPGLAFDPQGNRLGRGRGFYDRLLSQTSGVKCGVGYDFQLQGEVPAEPHDARVDFVFTPSRSVRRPRH